MMNKPVPSTIQLPNIQIFGIIHEDQNIIVYQGMGVNDRAEYGRCMIKQLRAEYPLPKDIARLKHEYEITYSLDLTGIIKSYDFIHDANALVVEDFGGISLNQMGRFERTEILDIAIQIAGILSDLHCHRIIHKDIKPENILYNSTTGTVKLTDFGIASVLSHENPTIENPDFLEGTLAYMSPEQTGRMNRSIDYRTDFYSLGVTFYELLTGQLPFTTRDAMELVHCHIAKQPVAPHLVCAVPIALSQIVMKLLAKNAEDRYQSACGLKKDLERCLSEWQSSGAITVFPPGQYDRSNQFRIPQKLYGREQEVTALMSAFERVSCGQLEMMLVGGYSGVGKSSLVNEIQRSVAQQRGYFISGKFDQFKRNIPYSSLIQAFRALMRQLLTESETKVQTWRAKLLRALHPNAQVIIDVIPEVELILGPQAPVPELGAAEAQNRFNLVFLQFIHVFAAVDHPLVVFLDDLQWADAASLKLIQTLMADPKSSYLLLIAAYRDNEVSPTHPFMLMLDEIRSIGVEVNEIVLKPLETIHVIDLLGEVLGCQADEAEPLADLLIQKTQGNPFFLTQLLRTLHQENWLHFDFQTGTWQWDIAQIRQQPFTDNVVDLMIGTIQKLSPTTQKVLQLAACVGNCFDLHTLAVIYEKSLQETTIDLWSSLQATLVVPLSSEYNIPRLLEDCNVEIDYRFLHDRVQQAAYALIPEDQKQTVHLKVGRNLLQQDPPQIEETLFDIVNHLNLASGLIESSDERNNLIQLNLRAAYKAKASTAFEPALRYVTAGIQLLPARCWQTHYALTFALYREQIEYEYILGNFEQAEQLCAEALHHCQTDSEKSEIHAIQLTHYQNSARYDNAIAVGLEALKLFGIDLPYAPTQTEILAAWKQVKQQLADQSIADLIHAPELVDPELQTVIRLMMNLVPPTYLINQPLLGLCVLKMMSLSLEHGNTLLSVFVYTWYGTILCGNFDQYATGYEFGQLALKLNEKFNTKVLNGKLYMSFGNFISHWSKPIRNNLEIQQIAYQCAKDSGDFSWCHHSAAFSFWQKFESFSALETLTQEHEKYIGFALATEPPVGLALRLQQHVLLNLAEQTLDAESLSTEHFNEQDALQVFRKNQYEYGINTYYFAKAIVYFTFEQYTDAHIMLQQAEKTIASTNAQYQVALHCFLQSLILTALYSTATAREQQEFWKVIRVNQATLNQWAENCPANFRAKALLVEAEIARISQDNWEAMELYDQAIAAAKESELIYTECLAAELTSRFYRWIGRERIGRAYLRDARSCYRRWGAVAKVKDLEQKYSHLFSSTTLQVADLSMKPSITTTQSSASVLDLSTVIKASQALTGELVLDRLLKTLMQIVLENAGAETGYLLFEQAGELVIQVEGNVNWDELISLQPTQGAFSSAIVNYVLRTQEHVVLDEATTQGMFTTDIYVLEHLPKSILCLPLIYQGDLVGILYLENNLVTGAFTVDRLEVLQVVCAQAAISIEKARLYQTLETANQKLEAYSSTLKQEVDRQTTELRDKNHQLESTLSTLQKTQTQLIQSEKMSSLGQLVAGVAHEINNPINFIYGNVNPAKDYTTDLLDLVRQYQTHYPNPVPEIEAHIEAIDLEFVATDLPSLLNSMKIGAERIKEIVQSLRTFSRMDEAEMKIVDIHTGIDSTLMILQNQLVKHKIEVKKTYGNLPSVECYAGQLNQVFMNILANAIDALEGRETPKIAITTEVTSDTVVIRIVDNGIGVDEKVRERLFDPFFTTKEVGKGTGLGLSISYQIVTDRHGGSLSCQSMPNQGTEFLIQIPLHQSNNSAN